MPLRVRETEKTQETEKSVSCNDPVISRPSEKTAPIGKTEKQQACPHPYAEVVTLFDGTTICNHCYDLINYEPDAEAA